MKQLCYLLLAVLNMGSMPPEGDNDPNSWRRSKAFKKDHARVVVLCNELKDLLAQEAVLRNLMIQVQADVKRLMVAFANKWPTRKFELVLLHKLTS